MKIRHVHGGEKIELMMTPMIDIVFLLLVFFIMTFKIVALEGDFNIKMPIAAPSEGVPDPDQLPPMKVRLTATNDGELAGIYFGQRPLGTDFEALRQSVRFMLGDDPGPTVLETAEVELDCDYDLKYEYVIQAVTAVSGWINEQGQIVRLVEKIKFAPPRQP